MNEESKETETIKCCLKRCNRESKIKVCGKHYCAEHGWKRIMKEIKNFNLINRRH